MTLESKRPGALRPLLVVGLGAVAGVLMLRWWKRKPRAVRRAVRVAAIEPVTPEVPWGVERPL